MYLGTSTARRQCFGHTGQILLKLINHTITTRTRLQKGYLLIISVATLTKQRFLRRGVKLS